MKTFVSSISSVKGTTKIVGILGDPVSHSLSPKMHNFTFSELNLDYVYVPFLVKARDLKSAVNSLRSLNLVGVNVTIPHKKNIIPYLDLLSPFARKIGAVNTIVNRNGKLIGHNTDAPGFLSALKESGKFHPKNKRAVIMGAGGVAHAITVALLESGIRKLVLFDKIPKYAQNLRQHLKKLFPGKNVSAVEISADALLNEMKDCDLFVNASPSDIDSVSLGIPSEKFLSSGMFVFEALYGRKTLLMLEAEKAGARYMDGLEMLIRQGALSFSIWTGLKPPVDLMRKALKG